MKEEKYIGYILGIGNVTLLGKFSPPEPAQRVSSVFRYKRSQHSKKPLEIRDYLRATFPDVPKIEMFARTTAEDWDSWGNEVKTNINLA